MGCLRLGCSFVFSCLMASICVGIGILLGSVIYSSMTVHGISSSYLGSSPLAFVQTNASGAYIGGSIGAIIGLLVMVGVVKGAADINWLKRYGTRIVATVTEIERKTGTRWVSGNQMYNGQGFYRSGNKMYNGQGFYQSGNQMSNRMEQYTYYIIVARWVDPQTKLMHTFSSPHLNIYPRRFYEGCGIEVLIDPNNMKRYYMEI